MMENTEAAASAAIGESSGKQVRSGASPGRGTGSQTDPLGDAVVSSEECKGCEDPVSAPGEGDSAALLPPTIYVYALGRIESRFPRLALEKEYAQVMARMDLAGKNDWEARHAVLSAPENRYLARQMCWVFSVEGMDTYILAPRDPADLDRLVEATRPRLRVEDVDIVIGIKGPIAKPEMCNGLMVPIVAFDQIYSFDIDELVKSIPKPETMDRKQFEPAAEELFLRIMQMADNAGATDEHRALNYLAVRYSAIYATTAEQFVRNFSLTGVESRPSRLSGVRRVLDAIFSYTNRQTDVVEKKFVRVDVTEEFPFLISKMAPYYDR